MRSLALRNDDGDALAVLSLFFFLYKLCFLLLCCDLQVFAELFYVSIFFSFFFRLHMCFYSTSVLCTLSACCGAPWFLLCLLRGQHAEYHSTFFFLFPLRYAVVNYRS